LTARTSVGSSTTWVYRDGVQGLTEFNRDTAVPVEGNGDLRTLFCVLVARPRRCPALSNPVLWQLGGLSRLHSADEDAVSWLTNYGSWRTYEKKNKKKKKKKTKKQIQVQTKQDAVWKACLF